MKRNVLKAETGKILTDGKVFGKTIYLGDGRTEKEFYSVSEDEYKKIAESEALYDREDCLD